MKTIMSVSMIFLLLAGCTKYENGPDFSVKSKKERLTNNWTVSEAVHLSGEGAAFLAMYPHFQLNIGEDDNYHKYYRVDEDHFTYEHGTWRFDNDKMNFITTCETGAECNYQILRLAGNQLWVRFTQDGNEWELHLHPKQTE